MSALSTKGNIGYLLVGLLGLIAVFFGAFIVILSVRDILVVAVLAAGICCVVIYFVLISLCCIGNRFALSIYLGLLVFIADASLRSQGVEAASLDLQSLVKLAMWGGALVISAFHFNKINRSIFNAKPVLLLTYALFAMLSAAWSTTPLYTFGAGVALISVVVFCALVTELLGKEQIIKAVLIALCVFISISLVKVIYYIAIGAPLGEYRHAGFAGSPNNLGRLSGLMLLFLWLWHSSGSRAGVRKAFLAIMALATLVLSQSRTAMAGAALSIAATFSVKRQAVLAVSVVVSAILLAGLIGNDLLDPTQSGKVLTRSGNTEEISTLTGRTSIWKYAWHKVTVSPIIGHGYAATREFMPREYFTVYGWTTNTVHNTVLQSLVTTGIVGTSMLLIIWGMQLFQFFRRRSKFRDSIFVLVIVSGITEAGVVGAMPSVITILWALSLFWKDEEQAEQALDQAPLNLSRHGAYMA